MNSLNDDTSIHAGEETCDGFPSPSTSSSSYRRHSVACGSASGTRPWYHGEMGKMEAERILAISPPGSFLVRLHGPSRYYLSKSDADSSIHHLPITQLSRQYYFNGDKYGSLTQLVDAFAMTSSFPLLNAVSPLNCPSDLSGPGPHSHSSSMSASVCDGEKFMCTTSYDGIAENDELSTTRGDIVSELDRLSDSDDWIWARNERTGAAGYLPADTVCPLLLHTKRPSDIAYFHDPMHSEALQKLVIVGIGSFLLRESSKGPDAFALLVNTRGEHIEKFLIRRASDKEGGFVLSGRRFPSIEHIVERYCRQPISGTLRLLHAVHPSSSSSGVSSPLVDDKHRCPSTISADSVPLSSDSHQRQPSPPSQNQRKSYSSSQKDLTDDLAADLVNHNCSTSHIVASVQALRKSREEKAWKPCFVTLRDDPEGGCHLFITESENSSRKRHQLDLSFCVLYLLDDSVLSREGCLFFSQHDIDLPGIFLCFRPAFVLAQWLQLLRPRVLGLRSASVPVLVGLQFEAPKITLVGLLHLYVDKYRSDALKSDGFYSAYGCVNGIKVCCTGQRAPSSNRASTPCVVFDSSFLLPFTPLGNGSLQLSLISHHSGGKKNRPFGLSPLIRLDNGPSTATSCCVNEASEQGFSFRAVRSQVLVHSTEQYAVIDQWLGSGPVSTLEYLSDGLSAQQRALLCVSLVSHYLTQPTKLIQLLESLVWNVLESSSAESVMRQDSLATALMSASLRVIGRAPLEDALHGIHVTAIKMPQPSDVENVVSCLDSLVSEHSLVLHILHMVSRLAERRFPGEPHLVRRVVSVNFVLRFANPIVINAMSGNPLAQQLAKGVQAAANGNCLSASSPSTSSGAAPSSSSTHSVGAGAGAASSTTGSSSMTSSTYVTSPSQPPPMTSARPAHHLYHHDPATIAAGLTFRSLFDRIHAGPSEAPPSLVDGSVFVSSGGSCTGGCPAGGGGDWLAIACHLLHGSLSTRPLSATIAPIPAEVMRILTSHQSRVVH